MNKKHQLTKEGLQALVEELDRLKNVDRVKNIQDLKDARAQGDLSENADYDAARDQQAHIEARIKELELIIKNVEIIDDDNLRSNLGKTVTVKYLDDEEEDEYSIVGSLESNPMNGKISNESPLGQAILHSKVGDIVIVKTDNGEFKVEVLKIK